MKIVVVKEKRKTICLKIENSQSAVLKVPKTLSQKEIDKFLEEKRKWIEKSVEKMKENENFASSFDLKNNLYIDGKFYANASSVVIGFDKLTENGKRNAIRKFYKSNFYVIEKMAEECCVKFDLHYDKLMPTTSVKVWGSYNTKKVMKLNWKLVLVPKELVYYVICHELSHSKHFNHSPKFWKEVENMCPDYKILKKKLSEYGFLLKNDF